MYNIMFSCDVPNDGINYCQKYYLCVYFITNMNASNIF